MGCPCGIPSPGRFRLPGGSARTGGRGPRVGSESNVEVFLTGATGFIGRHLLARLLEQGREVVALCRDPASLPARLDNRRLRVVAADLSEQEQYHEWLSAGAVVFHLAAVRGLADRNGSEMERVNVEGTLSLARAASEAGVERFIYVSTARVFGPSRESPVSESAGYTSYPGAYVQSRVRALQLVRERCKELPVVTACPTIVFGPDHPDHPNRITTYLRRLLRWPVAFVLEGGQQRRNMVSVEDLVKGLLQLETRGAVGGCYILGGEDLSPRQLNEWARSIAGGKAPRTVSVPFSLALRLARMADAGGGRPPTAGYTEAVQALNLEWRYSWEKAGRELEYSPAPVYEGIESTIRFVKKGR